MNTAQIATSELIPSCISIQCLEGHMGGKWLDTLRNKNNIFLYAVD